MVNLSCVHTAMTSNHMGFQNKTSLTSWMLSTSLPFPTQKHRSFKKALGLQGFLCKSTIFYSCFCP